MESFAFIVSLATIKQLKGFWPVLLKYVPSFRVLEIKRVRSGQGKEIKGYLIIEKEPSPDKIIASGKLAEDLGASILGLDGYIPMDEDAGQRLVKYLKIPLTSGSAFTAWSVFEAVYRIAKVKNIELKKSTLAVLDAASSIGFLCIRKLSSYVAKIIICAPDTEKLENLKQEIRSTNPETNHSVEVIIEEDLHKAVKDADIVISHTHTSQTLLNIEELKPKSIFCDISVSKSSIDKLIPYRDIAIIKAGLIKLPYPINLNLGLGLSKNIIWATLAETMLLTFEKRFITYSLGENINPDRLEQIADMAMQHGFEVFVPQAPVSRL